MSVLKLDDGKVLYRTPAHSGQRVTTLKVYPENGCLLSSGMYHCKCMAFYACQCSFNFIHTHPPKVKT